MHSDCVDARQCATQTSRADLAFHLPQRSRELHRSLKLYIVCVATVSASILGTIVAKLCNALPLRHCRLPPILTLIIICTCVSYVNTSGIVDGPYITHYIIDTSTTTFTLPGYHNHFSHVHISVSTPIPSHHAVLFLQQEQSLRSWVRSKHLIRLPTNCTGDNTPQGLCWCQLDQIIVPISPSSFFETLVDLDVVSGA
jgi:hypothetical protein